MNGTLSIQELHEIFFEYTDTALMHFKKVGNDLLLVNANQRALETTKHIIAIGQKLCDAIPAHRDYNHDVGMPLIDWYLGAIETGEMRHRTFRFEDSVPGRLALYWENTTIPCGEYCMMKFRDITEKELEQQRLREEAHTDALTQICNRRAFDIALKARCQESTPFALLLLDLNKFKSANDTYGHAFGDRLLATVAQRIKESLRECDRVFRLGGDEFAVILDGDQNIGQTAARIERAVQQPLATREDENYIPQVSIGCVRHELGDTFESIYTHADEALYRVKRNGSEVHWWICDRSQSYLILHQELLQELKTPQYLQLYYQPIIHLETGKIISYESLVRWPRPSGLLGASVILDIVRHYQLETKFCLWTIKQAHKQWLAWGRPEQLIAVNCSPSWLTQEAVIRGFLESEGITVEITEEEAIADTAIISSIQWLHHAHIKVSLDDFGSQYAGFGTLEKVPVDSVKLDQGLVDSKQLVSASAAFLAGLGLDVAVVAEGIDTKEKLEYCRQHVAMGQGFLFGRPLPGNAIDPGENSLCAIA